MKTETKTVFVGLSGGVDSSVAALQLQHNGYEVVGVFIKTWQPDFIECNWERERLDAMRVAAQLNIPFLTCDAEEEYRKEVGEYMINEYRAGRTPNPDVMCNKFVKFKTFLDFALSHGADMIATGHYAQVKEIDGAYYLYRGSDAQKDQSYFLWALTQEQLAHSLFPVGHLTKSEVRKKAKNANLLTSGKEDSQGVCFLGEIDMKKFLSHFIDTQEGSVVDEGGTIIGTHDGAVFYTIGQRHGFHIRTEHEVSKPRYVKHKDTLSNTLTVSEEPPYVDAHAIVLRELNEIGSALPETCTAQFRYRQEPFSVTVRKEADGRARVYVLKKNIDMPSVGQSCVLYDGNRCLGGGTIESIL